MNIISGKYKNRSIKSPNSDLTHPMGSRERLALFNMIQEFIPGASVLDAFAGTGALGLEALSRGADSVVFIEKSAKIAKTLKENITNVLGKEKTNVKVVISSVSAFSYAEKFDLIFADPPYDIYNEALVSPLISYLKPGAILCLSLPKTASDPKFDGMAMISRRNYASASVCLFQNSENMV